MDFNELTVGYSGTGTIQYIEDLNAIAITGTKDLLDQKEDIIKELNEGWVGQARENYIANFEKAIEATKVALDDIKKALDSQFANLEELWIEQDKNIVPLE